MPRVNPQSRSVGNQGDILKHAALFELASRFAGASSTVRYVDTHTFLLHAPPADVARWSREVDALASAHPAYGGYAALERASLARDARYRCSSGLVIDALGERRVSATLGEVDAATRAELLAQLGREQIANVVVVHDAVAALRSAARGAGLPGGADRSAGALLVHVDPFSLSPELWASLAPALDAACAGAAEAAVVVYRYTRGARTAWPAAPETTIGPVAQTRGGPHELAAYASAGVADVVRDICGGLGWQVTRQG